MTSLRFRTHLIFYLSTITFLLSLAITSLNSYRFKNDLIHNLSDHGKTVCYHIALSATDYLLTEDYSSLQEFIVEFTEKAHVKGIMISDEQGKILASHNLGHLGAKIEEYPDSRHPEPDDPTKIFMDEPGHRLIVTTPVEVIGVTIGWVRVVMSTDEIMKQLVEVRNKDLLLGGLLWLLSIGFGIVTARFFTKPMYGFMQLTDNITRGNFQAGIPGPTGVVELDNFSGALRVMADTIREREKELRQSEQKYRHLFERAMEGIFVCTIKGDMVDCNPAMVALLRMGSKKALLGKNLFSDYFPEQEDVALLLKHIMRNNFVQNLELRLKRNDGSFMDAAVSCHAVLGLEGEVETLEGLLRDVSIQKRAALEVDRMRDFLNNIYESMPSMLVTLDREATVTQWNSAAVRITSIPPAETIGRSIWDLLPFLAAYREQYELTRTHRHSVRFRHEELSKSNKKLFDMTFFPLVADDNVVGVAIRLDDVTDLESKEQQLRQAQKMECVGTLAGGLAHDFNNILSTILGNLSLTEFELNTHGHISEEQLRDSISNMTTAGYRAADLVRQLLTLSSKQEGNLVPVDLNLSIKHIKKLGDNSFDKSVHFTTLPSESQAYVLADPGQVEQVLLNLCINAVHAMTIMRGHKTWGGNLTVALSKAKTDRRFYSRHPDATAAAYWVLSISDTGVGMDPDTITKIFDPFFTTKSQGRGSGLGLTMVYNIIKQFHGFIEVNSQKAMGTTFHIYLPLLNKRSDHPPRNKTPLIYSGTGVILVVDDDELVRKLTAEILQTAGYRVLTAQNGREAVEIYRDKRDEIAAIILDMVMPVMSGKEAYLELRQLNPDVKVLLISGFRRDSRVEEVLQLGINDFLQKPFNLESMTKAMRDLLHAPSDQ
ncbi:MAG: response regulator [Desulfobulbaceae bacterium]|nr:response regulator [Desulfobulbaceae bacterium]